MARVVTMLMPSGFLLRQCLGSLFFNFFVFVLFWKPSSERREKQHFTHRIEGNLKKLKKGDDMRDDVLCNSSALLR